MIRRPPRSTQSRSSAASDVYKRQMINIMRGTFRQYELDPTNQNTVPGQFSEWYHGESLVNNGMKLSPWFPPKYLWTAVEGVCGIGLYRGLHINPNLPLIHISEPTRLG